MTVVAVVTVVVVAVVAVVAVVTVDADFVCLMIFQSLLDGTQQQQR